MQLSNLLGIFLTGLIGGGLSCMAVQGGLLAATIAQREQDRLLRMANRKSQIATALPILSFLTAKLIVYTVLGALLGWFGSFFQLSIGAAIFLQFMVAIFMLVTAASLLELHPIFRYFMIQPPRFLTKMIRKQSKSHDVFAPALLGAFTVFIPCGTTQAMMALAVGTANPLSGALVLFAFTLGTSPVFFLLGMLATRISDRFQKTFMRTAAYGIILFALFNANNAVALTGSTFTIEHMGNSIWCTVSFCETYAFQPVLEDATILIQSSGYSPKSLSVKAGSQVTLHLNNTDNGNCSQSFTLPTLGLQKVVPMGQSDTLTFVAPTKPGDLPFMCSMGMDRGVIHVI
jgi:uncharacterized protein